MYSKGDIKLRAASKIRSRPSEWYSLRPARVKVHLSHTLVRAEKTCVRVPSRGKGGSLRQGVKGAELCQGVPPLRGCRLRTSRRDPQPPTASTDASEIIADQRKIALQQGTC